jgi:hypothetical protein
MAALLRNLRMTRKEFVCDRNRCTENDIFHRHLVAVEIPVFLRLFLLKISVSMGFILQAAQGCFDDTHMQVLCTYYRKAYSEATPTRQLLLQCPCAVLRHCHGG